MAMALTKTKTQWSRRLDARLVRHVQRRCCLWDPSHAHYKSAPHRHQAYAELAKKCGQFSAETVKERWFSIRSTFAECLRQLKASHQDSTDMPSEPSWYLWKACQFLMNVKNLDDALDATDLLDSKIKTESTLDNDEAEEDDNQGSDCKATARNAKYTPDCNDIVDGLVAAFSGLQNGTLGQENNEFDKVGRLVAKKLSEMNSYEAALTSSKIMEILLLYDENNPDNPNNQLDIKYLEEES